MPLNRYGVLKCHATDRRLATNNSPHYQIRVTDRNKSHRIAVNVRSQLPPSEVLYLVDENFNHPITADLAQAAYLPGDLIDGHAWREAAARVERFADPLVEHHEGVVVAAVMHEETARVAHAG